MTRPLQFIEFFAGGGLARLGIAPYFDCVLANDIDPMKCEAYRLNFPGGDLVEDDIWRLDPKAIPAADLWWASFPCQDLSFAGARRGLNAPRSGAFWGLWNLLEAKLAAERAPPVIVLENVPGLLSSRRGRDFNGLLDAMATAGYRIGALMADAALFSPQSRARLFIIASRGPISRSVVASGPDILFHPPNLKEAVRRLSLELQLAWIWWRLPHPPARTTVLADMLQTDIPESAWRSESDTARLLEQMAPRHRKAAEEALNTEGRRVGAVYRRIRAEAGGRIQRAEIRYDGLAGCLRTPAGGSSRQFLLISERGEPRMRPLLPREAARLMGCPDSFRLPLRDTAALKVLGDGVAPPVVAWLAEHILAPLALAARKSEARGTATQRIRAA